MRDLPTISIITPSFNQGSYIERTIKSVVDQKYPNLEYIIIDGGSTDNTADVIEKYKDRISYYVSEHDRGQSHALNKGFEQATGDVVAWINSDDWYEAGTFNVIAKYFMSPGCDLVIGNCKMVYEGKDSKNFIDKPGEVTLNRMLQYWQPFFCPPQPAIFFKNALLKEVGYLDESLHYAMDLDLWLKLVKKTPFRYVDQSFANYLIHETSKSGSNDGLAKFVPEWKKVAFKHLATCTLLEKLKFYKAYYVKKERHY